MFIIVGNHLHSLAKELANTLKIPFCTFNPASFLNTERKIDIEKPFLIKEATILLIYQFIISPKSSLNDQLVDIFLLTHQLKHHGAKKITLLLPYLPYTRQTSFSLDTLYVCFRALNISKIYVGDIHDTIEESNKSFVTSVSFASFWTPYIIHVAQKNPDQKIILIAPDNGAINRIAALAESTGLSSLLMQKTRTAHGIIIKGPAIYDTKNTIAIIIDDIIDTGNTAIAVSNWLFEQGIQKIYGFFTHSLISTTTYQLLLSSHFHKIITTTNILTSDIYFDKKIIYASSNDFWIDYIKKHL